MIIITGKESAAGTKSNDSGNLNQYFELGWEAIITHLTVKYWWLTGICNRWDMIVTCNDRRFMYTKWWDNDVLSWREFITRRITGKFIYDGPIIDLPANIQSFPSVEQIKEIKSYLDDDDRNKIKDSFVKSLPRNFRDGDFACMVIRKRAHCPDRDLPEDYLLELIAEAKRRYPHIYVMGKDVESYCTDNMSHVTLQEFATLINHHGCKRVVGPLSGGMALNCVFGNAPATFIDAANERHNYFGDHPLMFAECVNIAGIHLNHIKVTRDWNQVFEG